MLLLDPATARAEYCLVEILSANLVAAAIPAMSTCSSELADRCTNYLTYLYSLRNSYISPSEDDLSKWSKIKTLRNLYYRVDGVDVAQETERN